MMVKAFQFKGQSTILSGKFEDSRGRGHTMLYDHALIKNTAGGFMKLNSIAN